MYVLESRYGFDMGSDFYHHLFVISVNGELDITRHLLRQSILSDTKSSEGCVYALFNSLCVLQFSTFSIIFKFSATARL